MIRTPVRASRLNQTGIFFSISQEKAITPGDFAGLRQLSAALPAFTGRCNHTARPSAGSSPPPTPASRWHASANTSTPSTSHYHKPPEPPQNLRRGTLSRRRRLAWRVLA
jgi:hypothetical protein